MKRVGGLRQQITAGVTVTTPDGRTHSEQLDEVIDAARPLFRRQDSYWQTELKPELADVGIVIRKHDDLNREQREKFIEKVADYFDDRVPRIDGWDEALDYLGEKLATKQLVVAIDEFPYLVAENGSLPSYLQTLIDEQLQETDSMLVLCGSSVSTMESEVPGHEATC